MSTEIPKKAKRQLTTKEWAAAEELWAQGNVTLAGLNKMYGAHPDTFNRHFKKKGIDKGESAAEHATQVKEEVKKNVVDDASVLASRIRETKEDHYKMATALGKLTWREVARIQEKKAEIATALPNLKALDAAMNVLKKVREERWVVLGLDNPDTLSDDDIPELVISELTADQIAEINRMQELNDLDVQRSIEEALEGEEEEVVEEGEDDS